MKDRQPDLGPTGETVAANVRRLREGQNLTYPELERRLDAVGRRIPVLGLRRLEACSRRVDTDDLLALALVLGVSPTTLLTPNTPDETDRVQVTAAGEVAAGDLWSWFLVQAAIDQRITRTEHSASLDGAQARAFDHRANPEFVLRYRGGDHPARDALMRLQAAVDVAVSPVDERDLAGWTFEEHRAYWATRIRRELRALSDLAEDLEAGRVEPESAPRERDRGDR